MSSRGLATNVINGNGWKRTSFVLESFPGEGSHSYFWVSSCNTTWYRLLAVFGCDAPLPSMVCVLSSFNLFFCLDCKCLKDRLFHKLMLEKTNHIMQWLTLNVLRLLRLQMLLGILSIICHCLLYIFSNQLHSLSSEIFMEKHSPNSC